MHLCTCMQLLYIAEHGGEKSIALASYFNFEGIQLIFNMIVPRCDPEC